MLLNKWISSKIPLEKNTIKPASPPMTFKKKHTRVISSLSKATLRPLLWVWGVMFTSALGCCLLLLWRCSQLWRRGGGWDGEWGNLVFLTVLMSCFIICSFSKILQGLKIIYMKYVIIWSTFKSRESLNSSHFPWSASWVLVQRRQVQ